MIALSLAWDAVAADFGTQGKEPAETNIHAMAGMGQTSKQAIAATKRLINDPDPCSTTKMGTRIHAAQDLATPAHAGVRWTGDYTAEHLTGDVFPSPVTLYNAYMNTINVLIGAGIDGGVCGSGW